eukprot:2353718-Rhodomonas_salina.2
MSRLCGRTPQAPARCSVPTGLRPCSRPMLCDGQTRFRSCALAVRCRPLTSAVSTLASAADAIIGNRRDRALNSPGLPAYARATRCPVLT